MRHSRWQSRVAHLDRKLGDIKPRIPIVKNIRLNFITLHYVYITSVGIIGSVVLFGGGNLSYTDALLFSTGTATQSGLNPVDLNKLYTYQQIWLWFGSMITNPIVIHSSVVFVRLYWFEKHFRHVVQQARTLRQSKSKARSTSLSRDPDVEGNRSDTGVRGKKIEVVRDSSGRAQGYALESNKVESGSISGSTNSSKQGEEEPARAQDAATEAANPPPEAPGAPDVAEVPRQLGHLSPDHSVKFLENQRRQQGALRIPSPREFDRGGVPEVLDDPETSEISRRTTTLSDNSADRSQYKWPPLGDQHITIDEPNIVRSRRTTTFPRAGSRSRTADAADQNELSPAQRTRSRRDTIIDFLRSRTQGDEDMPYLSWQPTIGRNSAFVDLTEEQRDELGGIEYRSLKTLALILVGYFFCFHLLGIVCLVPWIMETTRYGDIVKQIGQGRPWWAIFMAASAFNDQGLSITPDSMISFYDAVFPLLLMTFLIIIGNTGFPCMLRFVIWVLWKIVPNGSGLWEELHFLLDHPRRCFTLLFPRGPTWWLFGIVILLNGIDLVFFLILDIHTPEVTRIPVGIRFVDGLFQAASTRTAGLAVVDLSKLHAAVQVSYMIMMYISVYPIAISLRRTNVYEERSLGIYSYPDEEEEDAKEPSYVGTHLRKQLSFDLWYIFLGLFLLAIIEGSRLGDRGDYDFGMFAVLFEIVSAYGTVGLSLGYPDTTTSFCAQFKTLSKLIIIAMEIRGRHRGLPYELDRAILLPSESLHKKEAADAARRIRSRSIAMGPAASFPRSENTFPQFAGVGVSTGRQQREDTPVLSPRSQEVGLTEIPPMRRLSFANNVTKMPTHQEDH